MTPFATSQPASTSDRAAEDSLTLREKLEVEDTVKSYSLRVKGDSKTGSGVVIARHGDLCIAVTNAHVVSSGTVDPYVTLEAFVGEGGGARVSYPGSVFYSVLDQRARIDPAFIAFSDPQQACKTAPLAFDPASVGRKVFVVGNPGNRPFVTDDGVVTKVSSDVIHHDAISTFGNSGGGVFSQSGELLGIHTWGTQNEGLAIPVGRFFSSYRIHVVPVNPARGWQSSGLILRKGELATVYAFGTWHMGRCGLFGTWNGNTLGWDGYDSSKHVQGARYGALLVRPGNSGDPVATHKHSSRLKGDPKDGRLVAFTGPVSPSETCLLWMRPNESDRELRDNGDCELCKARHERVHAIVMVLR
jgi:V8-like Glu-specific endopeptidase